MTEVGIRALKQNASQVVARAAAGDVITVTDRGRPVARIVPIRTSRIQELLDAGVGTARTASLADLPAPRTARRGEPTPSEVLQGLRDGERY
jgi:prevent-host-death family protein